MAQVLPHYVNGGFKASKSTATIPVTNPANQEVLVEAPYTTMDEIDEAVAAAKAAFQEWRLVPAPERVRMLMKYHMLLKDKQDEIAELLSQETGKTFADAQGDVDYKLSNAEMEEAPELHTENGVTQICIGMKGIEGKQKLTLNTSKLEQKINSI